MSKQVSKFLPVSEERPTASMIQDLGRWSRERASNKETAASIRGANKSISALVARAGFTAFATNTVDAVKEAFRDMAGKTETSMLPAWGFIRSDFSHGALVAEYLMTGGKIKINAIIAGQSLVSITGADVALMLEGVAKDADTEISSLWKHVTKAKKLREETAEKAAQFEADALAEYLASKQCADEHKGMDVDELRDHLRVNGGYDTAMGVGRNVLKLKASLEEAKSAQADNESVLTNALGVLKRHPELRDTFLARMADLDTPEAIAA